jgi:hypothetical protein
MCVALMVPLRFVLMTIRPERSGLMTFQPQIFRPCDILTTTNIGIYGLHPRSHGSATTGPWSTGTTRAVDIVTILQGPRGVDRLADTEPLVGHWSLRRNAWVVL